MLKTHLRPSKAFQTTVGLKEVRLELFPEVDHVGTEGVKGIFLISCDFCENLFDFEQYLIEDQHLFVDEFLRELLKYFANQG